MKKLFACLVLPIFLTPLTIISTERELVLTKAEQLQLLASPASFTGIPKNPRLYEDAVIYLDENLTQRGQVWSADKPLVIKTLSVNDQLVPVFELSSGGFVEASQLLVFDDQVLSRQVMSETAWFKPGVTLYDKPYVLGTKSVKTDLQPYQAVKLVEQAVTYSGTYYRIDGKGWVASQDIYTDGMEAVQALLLSKYQKATIGVYVHRLDDGAVAESNADKTMYGASVTKLATIYETQRQLEQGTIKLTDQFTYQPAVNAFPGFYDPEGAGNISKTPDGQSYSVETLLKAVAQQSDNVASNMLGYYVAGKLGKAFQTDVWLLVGEKWNMVDRDLSAKSAGLMMAELYRQDGLVLEYLSETAFDDQRIAKDIPVRVAHKTGDADEFRHDVAIVYADRPFVLSIFTENASYEDITVIANDVYTILK